MNQREVAVSFSVTDFTCSPAQVTDVLGVQPTRAWLAGDAIQHSALRRKFHGWVLDSPLEAGSIADHTRWLLEHLPGSIAHLSMVTAEWQAELSCVVNVRDQAPPVSLDPELLVGLARLGAGIDVDIYVDEDSAKS